MFLHEDDLKEIERVLYTPKEHELKLRQIVRVNTSFQPYATSIGYRWYSREGSAKILAMGAHAKDIPFVDESGGESVRKVYKIVSGVRYTQEELMAIQASRTLGNGPNVSLELLRVETARKKVADTENILGFVGDATYNIKGLLNHADIVAEDVAVGATGSGDPAKRLWSNKTPKEKLADIVKGKQSVRQGGLFNPDVLVLPPGQFDMLDLPYSDTTTMTLKQWIQSQGLGVTRILEAKELEKTYNGFSTVDCFLMMDSSPEVAELAVTQDIQILPPLYDILRGSEQAVYESTAGVIIRHPKALYVGKGI